MKVFKIAIKFEQNGKWSEREVDTEGYLVKKSEEDDAVEGYIKAIYPTKYDSLRYIKGLYLKDTTLTFMQMGNDYSLSPICYVFPNIKEQGYWSHFSEKVGFFPILPGYPCANGHATICIEEIRDASCSEIAKETLAIFEEKSLKPTWVNKCLMEDYKSLTDFTNDGIIFQMNLHCGKW